MGQWLRHIVRLVSALVLMFVFYRLHDRPFTTAVVAAIVITLLMAVAVMGRTVSLTQGGSSGFCVTCYIRTASSRDSR